jgi:hypothetical protein
MSAVMPNGTEEDRWWGICHLTNTTACSTGMLRHLYFTDQPIRGQDFFDAGGKILVETALYSTSHGNQSIVTSEPILPRSTGQKLQALLDEAITKFNSGEIGLDDKQLAGIAKMPKTRNAQIGNVLEDYVNEQVANSDDPALSRLFAIVRGLWGPDHVDPLATVHEPRWYDFTTVNQWKTKVNTLGWGLGKSLPGTLPILLSRLESEEAEPDSVEGEG